MKTSQIQSQLARNAMLITALLKEAHDSRVVASHIKADRSISPEDRKEQRNSLFKNADKIGQQVNALASLQKALKKDLRTQPFNLRRYIKKVGVNLARWWRQPELM